MSEDRVTHLRAMKELLNNGAISQAEFDEMKRSILAETSVEPVPVVPNQVASRKNSAWQIILPILIGILVLVGAGGIYVWYTQPNFATIVTKLPTLSWLAKDDAPKSGTKAAASKSAKAKSAAASQTISSAASSSSAEETSADTATTDAGDDKFTALTQPEQLALLMLWGFGRNDVADQEINEATSIEADLNTPNLIVFAPEPGNMSITIRDNHDTTFNLSLTMAGDLVAMDSISGNELVDRYDNQADVQWITDRLTFR